MALLIPAIGDPREVTPANGRSFSLRELQAIVGGYIEVIFLADGRIMFMDEDGKRHERPINRTATALVRHRLPPDDVVVGDVIICTALEAGEGDDEEEAEELYAVCRHRTAADRAPVMNKKDLRQLKAWTRAVTRGQRDSNVFVNLWSDVMAEDPSREPVPVMQLGYAMLLDKPIVIIAPHGSKIPENVLRAARAVEFYDQGENDSLHAATMRALKVLHVEAKH